MGKLSCFLVIGGGHWLRVKIHTVGFSTKEWTATYHVQNCQEHIHDFVGIGSLNSMQNSDQQEQKFITAFTQNYVLLCTSSCLKMASFLVLVPPPPNPLWESCTASMLIKLPLPGKSQIEINKYFWGEKHFSQYVEIFFDSSLLYFALFQ